MKITKIFGIFIAASFVLSAVGCGQAATQAALAPAKPAAAKTCTPKPGASYDTLTIGFAQIGAESGWRDGETKSIRDNATKLKINLLFSDAQQKQENQIKAIRTFIAAGVDVIGIAPVVTTGWETVFQEAKNACIPIILVDRGVDKSIPTELYTTFIGSDFVLEGKNAADELAKLIPNGGNIIELEGTTGAGPAIDRKKGFEDEVAAKFPNIKIVASQTGDFNMATGKQVAAALIKANPGIVAVYAHNDEMALGAIQALEEAGLKPGTDVKVVSIDGEKAIFQAMVEGKANVTVECSPLLGPQFYEAALAVVQGKTIDRWIKSNEGIFRQDTAAKDILTRVY
jgi:ABC-type sugar transport system substrate-binding protein